MGKDYSWGENYKSTGELNKRISTWQLYSKTEGPFGVDLVPPIDSSCCILDACCGTGYQLRKIIDAHPEAKYYALDISPSMINATKTLCPEAVCELGSVERLPWGDNCFDGVVCMHALYHVENIEKACLELKRVMRDEAWGLITTVASGAGVENIRLHNESCEVIGSHRWIIDQSLTSRFNTENGDEILRKMFGKATFFPRKASLEFRELTPALDYYQSMQYFQNIKGADVELAGRLLEEVSGRITDIIRKHGVYVVNGNCGTWIIRKE